MHKTVSRPSHLYNGNPEKTLLILKRVLVSAHLYRLQEALAANFNVIITFQNNKKGITRPQWVNLGGDKLLEIDASAFHMYAVFFPLFSAPLCVYMYYKTTSGCQRRQCHLQVCGTHIAKTSNRIQQSHSELHDKGSTGSWRFGRVLNCNIFFPARNG